MARTQEVEAARRRRSRRRAEGRGGRGNVDWLWGRRPRGKKWKTASVPTEWGRTHGEAADSRADSRRPEEEAMAAWIGGGAAWIGGADDGRRRRRGRPGSAAARPGSAAAQPGSAALTTAGGGGEGGRRCAAARLGSASQVGWGGASGG
jgi:hypothetical protein